MREDLDQMVWIVEAFHPPGDCWLTLGVFSTLTQARLGYNTAASTDVDVAGWDYVVARPMMFNQIENNGFAGEVVLRDNQPELPPFEPLGNTGVPLEQQRVLSPQAKAHDEQLRTSWSYKE